MRQRALSARKSRINYDFGDRHNELTAPLTHTRQLLHDLRLQIPREDQHEIGAGLPQLFRRKDRNVGAGKKFSMLVGAAINGKIQKVGSDPAIVEERVPFSRSTIANYSPALVPRIDQ